MYVFERPFEVNVTPEAWFSVVWLGLFGSSLAYLLFFRLLGRWGATFNEGVDRMRRLVCEYYGGFSFGQFIRKFPDLKGLLTDLLIGDLFEQADAAMDATLATARAQGDVTTVRMVSACACACG